MLQTVRQKFSGGCMMVMRQDDDVVTFLGTAFLVHRAGYLLTVAHILPRDARLMVVPHVHDGDFVPLNQERLTPLPVKVARTDPDRDIALLRLEHELEIGLPDHFLGRAETLLPGSSLMAMGFSFGHQQIYPLMALNALASAKVLSRNQTRMLLFDTMVHAGDRGGPLVSVGEGLVVGIINGRFDPLEAARDHTEGSRTVASNTNVSYAVDVEHGIQLMDAEGLVVS